MEIPAPTQKTMRLGLRVLMYLVYQGELLWGGGAYSAMPSRSDVERTSDMSSSGVREKFTPIKEDFLGVIQWWLMMLKRHRRMSQLNGRW